MRQWFRRRRNRVVAIVVLVPVLVILGFGLYLGSLAGALPWQAEPTRIPITPFAGIPGFSAPTPIPASPTPLSTRTAGLVVPPRAIGGTTMHLVVVANGRSWPFGVIRAATS